MQYSKTKNPDQVLKHKQNKIILLTSSPFQLMFTGCLLKKCTKYDPDRGGYSKRSNVIPILRDGWVSLFIKTSTATITMMTID